MKAAFQDSANAFPSSQLMTLREKKHRMKRMNVSKSGFHSVGYIFVCNCAGLVGSNGFPFLSDHL